MRKAWNLASTASFILLLSGGVVILWLWSIDRLNADRVSSMYSILIDSSQVDGDQEQAPRSLEEDAIPGSSARRLIMRGNESRRMAVDYQVLEHQATVRQSQIDMALESLAQAREALAIERAALKSAQESSEAPTPGRDPEKQFRRSVDLIEAAQPSQGKIWLLAMIEQQRFEYAVAVLDAMQERSASRILREFKSAAEMELAGKLLEALGRYGTTSWPSLSKEPSERVSHGNESSSTR